MNRTKGNRAVVDPASGFRFGMLSKKGRIGFDESRRKTSSLQPNYEPLSQQEKQGKGSPVSSPGKKEIRGRAETMEGGTEAGNIGD